MSFAVQLRPSRTLAGVLVVLSGPALLPVAGALAAVGSSAPSLSTATSLSGFSTTRASVRVGGELFDAVTVLPRSARTVTVQVRRAGTTRFTNASTGHASATGRFVAELTPKAAGLWQFRLVVAAASADDRFVSPMRTVQASGRAAASRFQGFDSTATTVRAGTTVKDVVTVLPGGHRTVLVQARRLGTQHFTTLSTGRSSRAGTFTAVYRPSSSGAWAFRLVARANAIARRAVSPERTIKVGGVTPKPTASPVPGSAAEPTTTPTATPTAGPTPTPTTTPTTPPVATTTAVLSINGSTGPTAKQTRKDSEVFLLSESPGQGLSLVSGNLDYGDGTSQSFTEDPDTWIPDAHAYNKAGSYTATWQVIDSAGNKPSTSIKVTVFKDEPHADITETVPGAAKVGEPVDFTVTTDTPPDTSFSTYDLYSVVAVDPNSNLSTYATDSVFAATGKPTAPLTLTFNAPGTYEVDLVVDNDAGGEATATTSVTVL
jgi:hypothetical protein